MIFLKILCLNLKQPATLRRFLGRETPEIVRLERIHSDWIDFGTFARATGIQERLLRNGFLDQLGIPANTLQTIPFVQHCPDCLAMGYHCVLFELALIGSCPWHGKQLELCRRCGPAIYRRLPTARPTDHDSLKIELSCEHFSFDTAKPTLYDGINTAQRREIEVKCEELLAWIRKLQGSEQYSAAQMKPLWDVGYRDYMVEEGYAVCQSIATQIAGPSPWKLSSPQVPVCMVSHSEKRSFPALDQANVRANGKLGGAYETVKRGLYLKHVKPHSKCWNATQKRFESDPYFSFDDRCCAPSIAYLAWRHAIEGREALGKETRPKMYRVPFGVPIYNVAEVANSYRLLFYAIWQDVEHLMDHYYEQAGIIHIGSLGKTKFSVIDSGSSGPIRKSAPAFKRVWISFMDVERLHGIAWARCDHFERSPTNEGVNQSIKVQKIVHRDRFERDYSLALMKSMFVAKVYKVCI